MSRIVATFRRLWLEEHGWGKVRTGLAIAVALAGGGLVYGGVNHASPPPPPPPASTLAVSTSGNDSTCVRGNPLLPCLTLDRARDLASCGDTVTIASGSYSNQTVSGAPTTCTTTSVTFDVPSGTATFGTVTLDVKGITLKHVTANKVNFYPNCDYCTIDSSSFHEFLVSSADHTTINNNTIDGLLNGQWCQNFMWGDIGQPTTNTQDTIMISNNLIQNFGNCGGTHSEALYIAGYSRNVTVDGNTFYNNGNSAHIFVTWCQPSDCSNTGNNPDARDPKNVCIKNNVFHETWQAYFDITVRQETNAPNGHGIYTDDNIKIQPGQPNTPALSTDTWFGIHGVIFLADDNLWASTAYTNSPC